MFLIFAFAAVASASSLSLALHEPSGRPGPLDQCDVELCTSLLQRIEQAEKTVDIAVYGVRGQSAILAALKSAQERGVRVRAVVDMDLQGTNYYRDTDQLLALADEISTDLASDRRASANRRTFRSTYRCDRPEGFAGPLRCSVFDLGDRCLFTAQASRDEIKFQGHIMHHKFAVVDGRYLWTGSTNLSDSGVGGYNANLVVHIDSPTIAGWYTREFEQMLQDRYHEEKESQGVMKTTLGDGTQVQVLFSPQDTPITQGVRPLLKAAKKRIDVAVFFLTHRGISQDLIDAHRRGVRVRVILDATAATNEYSTHQILREAGIPVKIENWGGKMHAKSAVIDGRHLVLGSMNWTSAGEGGNDENTLLVESPAHAATYETWFERMWKDIPDRWLLERPHPESRDSGTACTDGADNNHDGLADEEDPGCGETPPELPALPPYVILPKAGDGCELGDFKYIHW